MHTVPENGFTTNKLILKLLNEQPSEVYRGKNAEELKDTLKNIEGLVSRHGFFFFARGTFPPLPHRRIFCT